MKPSSYNHFFPVPTSGVVLAYNAFNGALAEIEVENFPRVEQLLADPSIASNSQDHEFLSCLEAGGFLIPDPVDQSAVIRTTAKKLRKMGSILGVTIAPTLACNFRCDYCFQARSSQLMSEATQNALLEFCDRYLQHAEALRVWWFGGEPTTCMPILERVQSRLLELATKHQAEVYSGEIISNGYLLDVAMARRLRDIKITRAQITIDGPQEVHDRRRKLAGGGGTFHRILDNLSAIVDILEVNVRINIDKDNSEAACQVAETLQQQGILPRVGVQFGHVLSTGEACADMRDRCFTDIDFSRTRIQIYERLREKGIYLIQNPVVRAAGASCAALAEGYYVIGPDGYMFRCWEDLSLGPDKSIGSVHAPSEADERQKQNVDAYRGWDPFNMSECRNCNILPVCMGGCPALSMQLNGGKQGNCVPAKYHLAELISLGYRNKISRGATA